MLKTFSQKMLLVLAIAAFAAGALLRAYHVTENNFVFYDEGHYLNFNWKFVELASAYVPAHPQEWPQALAACGKLALGTGKALWFFLIDSRALGGMAEVFWLPRFYAALAGTMNLGLVYLLARRLTGQVTTALLSVVILSLLPSHVFYSHLGMQETLSTLLLTLGFLFYWATPRLGWRTLLSALFCVGAYYANYRLIIIPLLMVVAELGQSWTMKSRPQWLKYAIHTVAFGIFLLFIGNLDQGQNIRTTFPWLGHQAHEGAAQVEFWNFWSYPYYLFFLEHWTIGVVFLGGVGWCLYRRDWLALMPALMVLTQMAIFSLAWDKAPRYLCAVLPLLAIFVAQVLAQWGEQCKATYARIGLALLLVMMLGGMARQSWALVSSRTDYEAALAFCLKRDPTAGILSTQPWVHKVFVKEKNRVLEAPKDIGTLVKLYSLGYRYLIVDPQAYVSFTAVKKRFSFPLGDYLGFFAAQVQPLQEFDNFSPALLKRFVFEHNENLLTSLAFLSQYGKTEGRIRVYDLAVGLNALKEKMGGDLRRE